VESKNQDIRFKLDPGEDLSTMSDAELSQLQAMLTKLQGETIDVEPIAKSMVSEPPAGKLPGGSGGEIEVELEQEAAF